MMYIRSFCHTTISNVYYSDITWNIFICMQFNLVFFWHPCIIYVSPITVSVSVKLKGEFLINDKGRWRAALETVYVWGE